MNKALAMQLIGAKKKGVWFKCAYTTEVTLTASAKKAGHVVLKKTSGTFRVGISNNNRAEMKRKIAEGFVPQPRTWGTYIEGSDRFIEHTKKNGEHNYYAVLYSTPNIPHVQYTLDGEVIKKDELLARGIVPPSYFTSERTGVITVNLANIDRIG